MNNIISTYKKRQEENADQLPTCYDYRFYLFKVVEKLKISELEARTRYGQYTYGQWKELLGL